MGKFAYLIVGIFIGVFASLAGEQWANRHQSVERPQATAPAFAETYFTCTTTKTSSDGKPMFRDSTLIVRSGATGPETIIFPVKSDDGDQFRITETSATRIKAVTDEPKFPEAFTSMEFNRGTGEMSYLTRHPNRLVALFNDVCEKRVTIGQCQTRAEEIVGPSFGICLSVDTDFNCYQWKSGSNLGNRWGYTCRPSQRLL